MDLFFSLCDFAASDSDKKRICWGARRLNRRKGCTARRRLPILGPFFFGAKFERLFVKRIAAGYGRRTE